MAVDARNRGYGSVRPPADQTEKGDHGKSRSPPTLIVHGSLVVVFVAFGGGSFFSKFGIRGASPLLFELVREAVVAPFFLIITRAFTGRCLPEYRDVPRVVGLGLASAVSQACFFLGLKHENPMVGSTWQAVLPIFTTIFAVMAGQVEVHWKKVTGIVLASAGALWMALGSLSQSTGNADDHVRGGNWLGRMDGHLLFFGQCLCNALYFVMSKPIATKYGGISVSAWMWSTGSAVMAIFVFVVKTSWGLSGFVCEDPVRETKMACMDAILQIPSTMVWPLVYEVLICSVIAWWLLTWSLQHTDPSVVSVYTVLQPCTTCVLSMMAVGLKGRTWAMKYGIELPGLHNVLGGVLIIGGLWVMLAEETSAKVWLPWEESPESEASPLDVAKRQRAEDA